MEINLCNSFDKSNFWAINVRNILFKYGFGYIWESQNLGVDKYFLVHSKKRLIDNFWQTNNADINSLSVHRLYRNLENHDYLFSLPNNYIRVSLTRLRLGSHHLNIERGRWNRTLFEDRKCNVCNDIEDEFHFVILCSKYNDLRKRFLPQSLYVNPSMFKFVQFLNSNDMSKLKSLGLFSHHAFKKYLAEEIF